MPRANIRCRPRLAYQKKDMADWARSAGLAIKMRPTVFPVNSVKAMRGCICLGKDMVPFARAVFETYWGEDQDISQDAVLDRSVQARRRRPGKVLRRHRAAGDQGPAQGQYRRGDGARRVRLADHLRRQDRHVFRQRPAAADPRGAGSGAKRAPPDAEGGGLPRTRAARAPAAGNFCLGAAGTGPGPRRHPCRRDQFS